MKDEDKRFIAFTRKKDISGVFESIICDGLSCMLDLPIHL